MKWVRSFATSHRLTAVNMLSLIGHKFLTPPSVLGRHFPLRLCVSQDSASLHSIELLRRVEKFSELASSLTSVSMSVTHELICICRLGRSHNNKVAQFMEKICFITVSKRFLFLWSGVFSVTGGGRKSRWRWSATFSTLDSLAFCSLRGQNHQDTLLLVTVHESWHLHSKFAQIYYGAMKTGK